MTNFRKFLISFTIIALTLGIISIAFGAYPADKTNYVTGTLITPALLNAYENLLGINPTAGALLVATSTTEGTWLTVGSDGKVLMASSTADFGVSWERAAEIFGSGTSTQLAIFDGTPSITSYSGLTWSNTGQLLTVTGTTTISSHLAIGTTTQSSSLFRVATGTTEALIIDTTGNIGMGTTSPSTFFQLYGGSATFGSVSSNLTINSSGVVTSGTWQGTGIGAQYGGTGFTSYSAGDIIYATTTTALAKLPAGAEGEVLKITSGFPAWETEATGAQIDKFTASSTWTKPAGAKAVLVILYGAGGGGGSGNNATALNEGGSGGGGGARVAAMFDASALGATEQVTLGLGGEGGTSEANGSAGGATTFGTSSTPLLIAFGGGGGNGNSNGSTTSGGGGGSDIEAGQVGQINADSLGGGSFTAGKKGPSTIGAGGVNNGVGTTSNMGGASGGGYIDTNAAGKGGSSIMGAGGGGAGGSQVTGKTTGSDGGTTGQQTPGGGGTGGSQGVNGTAGAAGTNCQAGSGGGGGGGNDGPSAGGNGGAGGQGGGGGGGGGGTNGAGTVGTGGRGGDGYACVITFF